MNKKSEFIYALNIAYKENKKLRVRFKSRDGSGNHDLSYEGDEFIPLKAVIVSFYDSNLISDIYQVVRWEVV